MTRNTGSPMQYTCVYATICGATSLLALYGTMEHAIVGKSGKSGEVSHANPQRANRVEGEAVGKDEEWGQTCGHGGC